MGPLPRRPGCGAGHVRGWRPRRAARAGAARPERVAPRPGAVGAQVAPPRARLLRLAAVRADRQLPLPLRARHRAVGLPRPQPG